MSEATATKAPEATRPKRPRFRIRGSVVRPMIPYAVVLLIVLLTVIAVSVEDPDRSDPDYLSPAAASDIGGQKLAERLRAAGITVDVYTDVAGALAAAEGGGATLFLPAPEFLRTDQVLDLGLLPEDVRVVAVTPDHLRLQYLSGYTIAEERLATGLAEPGCDLPEAVAAGPAEVNGYRYEPPAPFPGEPLPPSTSCYGGSLVSLPSPDYPDFMVVGAPDPFLNERIDAVGNGALATGLLSAHPRVIWLDQHEAEPPPPQEEEQPEGDDDYTPPPASSPDNPLYKAFPTWMWALLIGILLVFVLAAMARGRRLGPPIAEPLPVQVPAAETVFGRARLYRRAAGRGTAFAALRDGALSRILPVVGVSSKAGPEQIVAAIAGRTGQPAEQVRGILYRPEPLDDQDLLNSIHALDSLEYAVFGERYHERHKQ